MIFFDFLAVPEMLLVKNMSKMQKRKKKLQGDGISLTNNDIKDIIKVINSLENGGVLLNGTTRKISSHKREFLNFLRSLISVGLPIMKNVLTSLAKNLLVLLGLTTVASAIDTALQNTIFGLGLTALIIWNKEMEDIKNIVQSLE